MKQPNVILMFVDDLGYGDISAFNENGKIHTPNINALTEGGIRFTDSHACSALCTPSRYGLLTGRYNWRSRLKCLVLPGDSEPLIEKDRMTMAHLFQQNGYHTACVGKWHLGLEWQLKEQPSPADFGEDARSYEPLSKRPRMGRDGHFHFGDGVPVDGLDIDFTRPITFGPNQFGFEYFYGLPASLDQPPYVYVENDHVLEQPDHMTGEYHLDRDGATQQTQWQRGPIAPGYHHEQVLPDMNNKVLDLIDEYSADDKPFFIYYPTPAVHGPLLPTPEFKGKSGLNLYADVVLQVDDMVRQISEKLKANDIFEDTIFIFTSDNGCSGVADYPFLLEHGHNPSYIFRGKKFDIYEGGHRVPTIVHYPAMIRGAQVCDSNVCHVDFFRTFADMLGVALPDEAAEDSISNLPIWTGKETKVREDIVYSAGAGFFAIQKGPWKLELCEGTGAGGPLFGMIAQKKSLPPQGFQLYNLETDIGETTNVIDQHPELVAELKQLLTEHSVHGRSTPGKDQKNFEPEYWPQINWI